MGDSFPTCACLQDLKVMDYSLLLGVHYRGEGYASPLVTDKEDEGARGRWRSGFGSARASGAAGGSQVTTAAGVSARVASEGGDEDFASASSGPGEEELGGESSGGDDVSLAGGLRGQVGGGSLSAELEVASSMNSLAIERVSPTKRESSRAEIACCCRRGIGCACLTVVPVA